jgi:triacylglycerol lipase
MRPGLFILVASLEMFRSSLLGRCLGLAALFLLAGPVLARAEALVLIHGYLGDGDLWYTAGVASSLEEAGWHDGGHLRTQSGTIAATGGHPGSYAREFFAVDLPAEAPLLVQSARLADYLRFVRRFHKKDRMVLVGHSAGGVVARLTMVQHPTITVSALITIATPHLGTDSAELGAMASASPLGLFAPLMGVDILNKSRGLYADLVKERPGTVLFWLNRQPHPNATYISVVRKSEDISLGEFIVPAYSQDMAHVYALRGKTRTVSAPGEHALSSADGALLVRLLKELPPR